MNSHFQALERKIERRRRALNALAHVSHWTTISLGLSLVYLGAVTLGLLPPQWPLWALGAFNILVGLAGWLIGRWRSIDLATALFQVDRALGTGEALCTYHEFSGSRARRPFTQRLEEEINTIAVNPALALPITHRQRRRILAIAGLVVACLWLGSLEPLHVIPTGLAGVAMHKVESTAAEVQSDALQPQNSKEIQQIDTQASQLAKQLRIEAPPAERRTAAAELSALYQKLRDAQQELWKLPNGSSSPSATPTTEGSTEQPQMNTATDPPEQADARRLAEARQAAQALQQALEQLNQTLNTLQEQGQTGASDAQAIQQALERLAQQAPNDEIRQSLTRATQAQTPQEQRQLISKAQQQLQDLLKQDQQLEQTQQEIARALREGGQRPTPAGDMAQANGTPSQESNSQASDSQLGAASQYTGGGKRASDTGEGKNTTNRPSGSAGQATQQSGGDQPGTQEGANVQEAPSDQSSPPQRQLVVTHDRLPSDVQLQTVLLSKGVPFETASSSPDGGLILRYDFAKAESLLKLRGVPPTLRDLIRQYFVAITAEPQVQP